MGDVEDVGRAVDDDVGLGLGGEDDPVARAVDGADGNGGVEQAGPFEDGAGSPLDEGEGRFLDHLDEEAAVFGGEFHAAAEDEGRADEGPGEDTLGDGAGEAFGIAEEGVDGAGVAAGTDEDGAACATEGKMTGHLEGDHSAEGDARDDAGAGELMGD